MAFFLVGLRAACAGSGLSGIWALNRAKSNFGKVMASAQLVVRIERTGSRVATWRITTDSDGQHVSYRDYAPPGKQRSRIAAADSKPVTIALPAESTGATKITERWQVSEAGRLIIYGSIAGGPRTVDQLLVLEPSTGVQETNPTTSG